ncbi:MAG: outer membrane protein assembly factor BamA [Candidatus Babeliales bacterium]
MQSFFFIVHHSFVLRYYKQLLLLYSIIFFPFITLTSTSSTSLHESTQLKSTYESYLIGNITILFIDEYQHKHENGYHNSAKHILPFLAFKQGEKFSVLTQSTSTLIKRLYATGKYENIIITCEPDNQAQLIHVTITIKERHPLKGMYFFGNTALSQEELEKKLKSATLFIGDTTVQAQAEKIKTLYREKGYHAVTVNTHYTFDKEHNATVAFFITEHQRAIVKHITFVGNKSFSSKVIKSVLFTKEDWPLSFLDHSGIYQPERIDADRLMIEQFYHNHGFLKAFVSDTKTITEPETGYTTIEHHIHEGSLYRVGSITLVGGETLIPHDILYQIIPIKPGSIYSKLQVINTIKQIELMFGDLGYLYTHVEPSMQPNEAHTCVDITLHIDPEYPITLNTITITGNSKVRDKVIRRLITLNEGMLISKRDMEISKGKVESLGYFDRKDGVTWKTVRLSRDTADLELVLKEIKTGNAHAQLSLGGSDKELSFSSTKASFELALSDNDIAGTGIRGSINSRLAGSCKTLMFNLTQPWLFDKPIYGAIDGYHKRVTYDRLRLTKPMNEQVTGGVITSGFSVRSYYTPLNELFVRFGIGIEKITYEAEPEAIIPLTKESEKKAAEEIYTQVLNSLFKQGHALSCFVHIGQDKKNHPLHPSNGYNWLARSHIALPVSNDCLGFYRLDLDYNWFTPLIGTNSLIFRFHTYLGLVTQIGSDAIPYKELFHIGGPASVRGFVFGEIGPHFVVNAPAGIIGDSIGGRKGFIINAELIFPIQSDFSMKGVLFYDGGAGWDAPLPSLLDSSYVAHDRFDYRHAIGMGIRVLRPVPLRVDVGFKLDPRENEKSYEVHFGMSYDF